MQPPSSDFPAQSSPPGQLAAGAELSGLDAAAASLRNSAGFPFPLPGYPGVPFDLLAQHAPKKPKIKQPKTKHDPPELDIAGPSGNAAYQAALADQTITIAPQSLGFLPSNYWLNVDVTFGELVNKFFQRKNNANCRFPHKLFNALELVQNDPHFYNLMGVQWVTNEVFKVDKLIFGRLLGITSIEGGLFHRQGNFPSHGFAELTQTEFDEVRATADLSDVDHDRIRLLVHSGRSFSKGSNEDAVTGCKWITDAEPKT
jgi:hypothetical protein